MHRHCQLEPGRPLAAGQRGRVRARAIPLILDTGPLLAAIDVRDDRHAACAELLTTAREPRIIPAPVLVELDYFLTRSFGPDPIVRVLADIRDGAFEIEPLIASDYERISSLIATYADLRVGFVDAAVLAVVERLREPKLATLDHRHFGTMRPRHVASLTLLPD